MLWERLIIMEINNILKKNLLNLCAYLKHAYLSAYLKHVKKIVHLSVLSNSHESIIS